MIKLFRNIRKNLLNEGKTTKYFKYAIGEIVLVVIGILIALQINNWNEERKLKFSERTTLQKFVQDLKSDSIFYKENLKITQVIDSLHTDLYKLAFHKKENITLNKPAFIRRALVYNPIAKANNPNIGTKISDERIRENIQSYYRMMADVLEAQEEHENVVFEIRSLLRKQHVHDIKAWFESHMILDTEGELNSQIISSQVLVAFSQNKDFQQLLFESSIKLRSLQDGLIDLIQDNSDLMNTIRVYINEP